MTRILFVINPHAGQKNVEEFDQALEHELSQLWDTGVPETSVSWEKLIPESPEQMRTDLRQRFSENPVDILGVVGGDGTIMEVLPVLVEFPGVKLALIAYGTGNLLAANLSIPKDFAASIHTIFHGRSRRIDLARINNSYFALIAGVGVVADIMESTPRADKKRFGILAYLMSGLRTVWHARRSRFKVTTEDKTYRAKGVSVLVSNAASFLGPCVPLTPDAQPDDGLLDVCIIKSRSNRDYFPTLLEAMAQSAPVFTQSNIIQFRARKLTIESSKTLNVQADGNLIGTTPVEIEIIRNRLQVMVPLAAFDALDHQVHDKQTRTSLVDTLKCYLGLAKQEAGSGLRS